MSWYKPQYFWDSIPSPVKSPEAKSYQFQTEEPMMSGLQTVVGGWEGWGKTGRRRTVRAAIMTSW